MINLVYRRLKKGKFTELKSDRILETINRLEKRIEGRFPDSGLGRVCREFIGLAKESETLALRLAAPIWPVRIASGVAGFLLLSLALWASGQLIQKFSFATTRMQDVLQSAESAINELIFLAISLYFLVNLETRLKQRAALRALHQLRSIAHVVDMHQLTKDPAFVLGKTAGSRFSPKRKLTRAELTRYLEYCSEMLSLVSKIAALFAQNMADPVVLNAVNEVESLTQGLSGKIWQKIMIIDLSSGSN